MNRIDRLHAVLTHLQSKKRVTAQEIADRFEISLRTVYRDVKALEESGVPVIGEAGSGYTIMEGYRLPPVMFTQEEASALLLGAKLAEKWTDSSVRKSFETAMFKIKAVLRSSDKEHMDVLADHIEVLRRNPIDEESSSQHLVALQKSIAEKRVIYMRYQANSDEITERLAEPIGLCYYSMNWHLIGWCRLRNGYRDFRVSRIQRLQLKDESFVHKSHKTLQDYISTMMQEAQLQEAVVSFSREIVKYLQNQKYYYGFVRQEEEESCIRMHFLVSSLHEFAHWLLMVTDHATVESPSGLVDIMKSLAERLSRHYQ